MFSAEKVTTDDDAPVLCFDEIPEVRPNQTAPKTAIRLVRGFVCTLSGNMDFRWGVLFITSLSCGARVLRLSRGSGESVRRIRFRPLFCLLERGHVNGSPSLSLSRVEVDFSSENRDFFLIN